MAFDPSVKVSLTPSSGGNISMDWNQVNIAREGESAQNVAKAIDLIGNKLQDYAIKERDLQIKADILAINKFRQNKWKEAQIEFENSNINSIADTQKFWEKKSKQIEDITNKELQTNGRWYDDCKNFVDAESREVSTTALLGFQEVLANKNRKRNEEIANAYYEDACVNNDSTMFEQVVGMRRAMGWTDEQIQILGQDFKRKVNLNNFTKASARIEAITNNEQRVKLYEKLISSVEHGGFDGLTETDRTKITSQLSPKIATLTESNEVAKLNQMIIEASKITDPTEQFKILKQISNDIDKSGLSQEKQNQLQGSVARDSVSLEKQINVNAFKQELAEVEAIENPDERAKATQNLLQRLKNNEFKLDETAKVSAVLNLTNEIKNFPVKQFSEEFTSDVTATLVDTNPESQKESLNALKVRLEENKKRLPSAEYTKLKSMIRKAETGILQKEFTTNSLLKTIEVYEAKSKEESDKIINNLKQDLKQFEKDDPEFYAKRMSEISKLEYTINKGHQQASEKAKEITALRNQQKANDIVSDMATNGYHVGDGFVETDIERINLTKGASQSDVIEAIRLAMHRGDFKNLNTGGGYQLMLARQINNMVTDPTQRKLLAGELRDVVSGEAKYGITGKSLKQYLQNALGTDFIDKKMNVTANCLPIYDEIIRVLKEQGATNDNVYNILENSNQIKSLIAFSKEKSVFKKMTALELDKKVKTITNFEQNRTLGKIIAVLGDAQKESLWFKLSEMLSGVSDYTEEEVTESELNNLK